MSAVITQRLVDLSRQLEAAPRGQRTQLCEAAATELGLSIPTIYRRLGRISVNTSARKRRSDAGTSALTRDEALTISTALIESARRNEKRLYSIGDAVAALRASDLIRAEFVDEQTGEIRQLSDSAISRALYNYRLHPEQLLAPAPVTTLASRHPNHVWQIDASLCVLYYLRAGEAKGDGLQVMDSDKFYKNKPRNVARISANRVWSYEITDHASGWIYVEYVMGAESGENLCHVLINAMQDRGGADVLHGRPAVLMMDPGSANTSAMAKNLCRSLGIEMIVHAPGAARVTGQVENARNLIERKFEAGLRFAPVADLDALNALARRWREHFNATAVHTRHSRTRTDVWMTIREDQLVKVPSVETCRALAVAEPESRKVTSKLRVSFHGHEYDVSPVPGVMVGEAVMVTRNPWHDDAAQVVAIDENGRETYYVVPRIVRNDLGFDEGAAIIGETHRQMPETPAQTARREAARLAMEATTDDEADTQRKRKAVPFGGKLKPFQQIDDAQLPTFLPRRGTEHELSARVEIPPLNHIDAAKQLRAKLGDVWTADSMQWLKREFPAGVPESELDEVAKRLTAPARPALRVVGGEK